PRVAGDAPMRLRLGYSQVLLHHEACDPAQRFGALAEGRERLVRADHQAARKLARLFEPEQCGIGGLAAGFVLMRALAQLFGRSLDVENVVGNLKGETQRTPVGTQPLE